MEEIQQIIDVNLLTEYCPIVSEIKWCPEIPKVPDKHINSSQKHNNTIRNKWRVDYTVPTKYVPWNEESWYQIASADSPTPGQEPGGQASSQQKGLGSAPPSKRGTHTSHKAGDSISAIEALNGTFHDLDVRPRIFDKITKTWILLDSGSCVSCHPPGPNDVLDPSFKLKSVNGGSIDTYGTKEMSLQIGRKTYSINAVIAAVPAPIFGWDIFKKYQLSLGWDQDGDIVIKDKKAQISSKLNHVLSSLPLRLLSAAQA